MAKPKTNPGVQNRAIYSRASYLYQAASYLASRADEAGADRQPPRGGTEDEPAPEGAARETSKARQASEKRRRQLRSLSRHAVSEMRAVALKTQIRQSQALKRTICKFCDTLLLEGQTCRSTIENPSRGGLKPWADVLVMRCQACGNAKRFPVSASRQKRKALRPPKPGQAADEDGPSDDGPSGPNV